MTAHALLGFIRSIGLPQLRELLGRDQVLRRAEQYAAEGRVAQVWVDGAGLRAHVTGSSTTPYHCVVRLHDGQLEPECSCPFTRGICWHVGAVLLTLTDDAETLAELERQAHGPVAAGSEGGESPPSSSRARSARSSVSTPNETGEAAVMRERLLALPKELLATAFAELLIHDPVLEAKVLDRSVVRQGLEIRLFRQAVRAALRPGHRLTRYEVPRVAADLEEIVDSVGRLLGGGTPEAGLDLMLEIAWQGWTRLDDADDRDGALVALVQRTLLRWVHGWRDIASRDRQKIARELFGWVVEDHGAATQGLIVAARDTLGPIGIETLVGLLRPVLQQRIASLPAHATQGETPPYDPLAQRIRSALREAAEARGQLDEFLLHCDPEGANGDDLLAAVQRLAQDGQMAEALRWIEKGRRRASGSTRAALDDLRIALLLRLERRREAIEAAWGAFVAEPGAAALQRLLSTVPEAERTDWRRRALDHAESGVDSSAFVAVCLEAEDHERLSHRLDAAPSFVLAAAAETLESATAALEERIPWAAARIAMHLAGRWLALGDARHYRQVRVTLERAQRCYRAANQREEGEAALARLIATHAVVRAWFPG